ncbi:MAG: hypothetical protein WBP02_00380, partial [Gammaproteobacteria bacterium]
LSDGTLGVDVEARVNLIGDALALTNSLIDIQLAYTSASDSDNLMEEWYYAQWEALRLAIHKYYRIDDNDKY